MADRGRYRYIRSRAQNVERAGSMGVAMRSAGTKAIATAGLAIALALAMPSGAQSMTASEWSAEFYRDHPLVGAHWSSHDERTLGTQEALDRLAAADVVILGEIHDNPDHHRLQARMLQALVERGWRPAVVFEMIPHDLQDTLDAHLRDSPGDADGLGRAVGWEERGWPDWSMYQPIAEVAIGNQLAIRAGGLSQDLQRKLSREGADALDRQDRQRLGLMHELPSEAAALLDEALFRSHCDLLPRHVLPAMRLVQWARDGAMAAAIEQAAEDGPVVLIAGAGHARRDWGVPAQLAARDASLDVATVALVEVTADMSDAREYLPAGAGQSPVYDLLVFTPRADRDDPCEALRDHLDREPAP
jgi:uncharacterized iron-regulated protein